MNKHKALAIDRHVPQSAVCLNATFYLMAIALPSVSVDLARRPLACEIAVDNHQGPQRALFDRAEDLSIGTRRCNSSGQNACATRDQKSWWELFVCLLIVLCKAYTHTRACTHAHTRRLSFLSLSLALSLSHSHTYVPRPMRTCVEVYKWKCHVHPAVLCITVDVSWSEHLLVQPFVFQPAEDVPTLFRGNSIATSSMEEFIRGLTVPYLNSTIKVLVTDVMNQRGSCEVCFQVWHLKPQEGFCFFWTYPELLSILAVCREYSTSLSRGQVQNVYIFALGVGREYFLSPHGIWLLQFSCYNSKKDTLFGCS